MYFGSADLDKIKMGMIIAFESDGGFINNRIQAYQEYIGFDVEAAKITHVGISMGGPYMIEATFPQSKTSNLFQDHQGRKLRYYYYRGDLFRDCLRKNVTVWAASRCNLDYGWPALLGFYLKSIIPIWGSNPLGVSRQPFCSYLIAWAFRRVGIDPWQGIASDLITPAHIAASDLFEEIDVTREGLSTGPGVV